MPLLVFFVPLVIGLVLVARFGHDEPSDGYSDGGYLMPKTKLHPTNPNLDVWVPTVGERIKEKLARGVINGPQARRLMSFESDEKLWGCAKCSDMEGRSNYICDECSNEEHRSLTPARERTQCRCDGCGDRHDKDPKFSVCTCEDCWGSHTLADCDQLTYPCKDHPSLDVDPELAQVCKEMANKVTYVKMENPPKDLRPETLADQRVLVQVPNLTPGSDATIWKPAGEAAATAARRENAQAALDARRPPQSLEPFRLATPRLYRLRKLLLGGYSGSWLYSWWLDRYEERQYRRWRARQPEPGTKPDPYMKTH